MATNKKDATEEGWFIRTHFYFFWRAIFFFFAFYRLPPIHLSFHLVPCRLYCCRCLPESHCSRAKLLQDSGVWRQHESKRTLVIIFSSHYSHHIILVKRSTGKRHAVENTSAIGATAEKKSHKRTHRRVLNLLICCIQYALFMPTMDGGEITLDNNKRRSSASWNWNFTFSFLAVLGTYKPANMSCIMLRAKPKRGLFKWTIKSTGLFVHFFFRFETKQQKQKKPHTNTT